MIALPAWLTDERLSEDIEPLLRQTDNESLERLAAEAQAVTLRRFGRVISLYTPLYLSNFCSSGCVYCGFASDRRSPRRKLDTDEIEKELLAMKALGVSDVLLLTGERTNSVGFDYLRRAVDIAARHMPRVAVEAFPMSVAEYRGLAECGCTGLTIYQETYDPDHYRELHRWGPKQDFLERLETPERAITGGIRSVGIGALLGLSEPVGEALAVLRHARYLCKTYWKAGVTVSFPRIRPQEGGFQPSFTVSDRFLARMIFAFRIGMPDVDLVLSTRESSNFRDGMAGLGITRMSIASRTTVGGYVEKETAGASQFEVSDNRSVEAFCAALRAKDLEPVFKNWDAAYNNPLPAEECT
ncbi:MAG TPA: 2-iminoacetate synthase ThiH [Chlorobaculum sp.]|uniref:ThiH protein n=1 Tax=Chlorobaculum tepidum (strain ATCC 49652 / DSM 12025 / NBRC 103806 / TLS) TaxID=194439 RepID=Q8KEJ2_CHLTE|nr:2-iminoacetate synthase ThiH [Chlorobaculum tepidum]AAM71934.1 ThiH protein [Chlorobaculum tepidum TLS]HBU22853.1 2-iminoacetate synthase ThiH [Chlorobaculum sp.]